MPNVHTQRNKCFSQISYTMCSLISIDVMHIICNNDHFTWKKKGGKASYPNRVKYQKKMLRCHGFLCSKTFFHFKMSIAKHSVTDTWCTGFPYDQMKRNEYEQSLILHAIFVKENTNGQWSLWLVSHENKLFGFRYFHCIQAHDT